MVAGFYPRTFLQPGSGSKNSVSLSLLKYFLAYLSRKTLGRFFYFFTPLFFLYKPQILTKETGLSNWFVIPRINLCNCVLKIKNKHNGGVVLFFFASACVIHVTMRDWLCYLVTKAKALGTKKCKSLRRSINEGLYNLIPKETCIARWKKKLPAKKN